MFLKITSRNFINFTVRSVRLLYCKHMKLKLLRLIFLPVLVSLFTVSLMAQKDSTVKKPTPDAPLYYRVHEIPNAFISDKIKLKQANLTVLPYKMYEELKARLTDILEKQKSLTLVTGKSDFTAEYTEVLSEYLRLWNKQKRRIDGWNDEVSETTAGISEQKSIVRNTMAVWNRTYAIALADSVPEEILQKIIDIEKELKISYDTLTVGLNRLLALQHQIVEPDVTAEMMVTTIRKYFLLNKQDLFYQNSSTLWDYFAELEPGDLISNSFSNTIGVYIGVSDTILQELKGFALKTGLYLLFVAAFILFLSRFSKKLPVGNSAAGNFQLLLQTPFSTILFIFLISFNLLVGDLPELVLNSLRLLSVIPLVRIFLFIYGKTSHRIILVTGLLLAFQQVKMVSGSGSETERLILTFILFFTVIYLVLHLYGKGSSERMEVLPPYVKNIFVVILVLFATAFIANLFGFLAISLTIVNGVLNAVYGLSVLLIVSHILQGLVYMLIMTKTAKISLIMREYETIATEKISKFIRFLIKITAVAVILRSFGMLVVTIDFLGSILKTTVSVGDFSLTLETLVYFFFSVWFAVWLAKTVKFLLEKELLVRIKLARGVPTTISAVISYLIVGMGIVFAIISSGLDLNRFSLLAGALGVGIGFGLQDIVRNFISGIILIFERPVQIGDAVEVEDLSGTIRKIGIRSSVIKTWEGAEVIVPNGNLISNKVINWTLSDNQRRIDLKIGVAYGSNVEKVIELLRGCATSHEKILQNPPPVVFLKDFADSALLFEMRCWTADFGAWVQTSSDLRVAIDKVMNENGIEIPFPQRDVHIKNPSESLPPAKPAKKTKNE